VKLHTVIVVPNGARNAPVLLTRTPYNASARAERNRSPHIVSALPLFDELFAADGYIRVYQDVRQVRFGGRGRDDTASSRTVEQQHRRSLDVSTRGRWRVTQDVRRSPGRCT